MYYYTFCYFTNTEFNFFKCLSRVINSSLPLPREYNRYIPTAISYPAWHSRTEWIVPETHGCSRVVTVDRMSNKHLMSRDCNREAATSHPYWGSIHIVSHQPAYLYIHYKYNIFKHPYRKTAINIFQWV